MKTLARAAQPCLLYSDLVHAISVYEAHDYVRKKEMSMIITSEMGCPARHDVFIKKKDFIGESHR
jgi:hypothetical protein